MSSTRKKRTKPPWTSLDRPSVDLEGRPFLNLREAAHFLAISPWTIRECLRRGEMECIRVGRRLVFDREELLAFMYSRKRRGAAAIYTPAAQRNPA